jgi:DNA-binding NarL/FixJ family response regulator
MTVFQEPTTMFTRGLLFPRETNKTDGRSEFRWGLAGPKSQVNPTLSFRERQVVYLVCKGRHNKEIAHELLLTQGTVKEYLNRIFRKGGPPIAPNY